MDPVGTFQSVTHASKDVAIKFVSHFNGNLNQATMAYFQNPTPHWLSGGGGGDDDLARAIAASRGGRDDDLARAIAASKAAMNQQNAAGKKPAAVRTFKTPNGGVISLAFGDLTMDDADAVVNPANKMLDHAGGLAAQFVKKGGHQIQDESFAFLNSHGSTNQYGRLYMPDGSVAVTKPGRLPCKHLLHAVGPVWSGGAKDMSNPLTQVMRKTVTKCLKTADLLKATSLSLPGISTGKFGFPVRLCARIVFESAYDYFKSNPGGSLRRVTLTEFTSSNLQVYTDIFDAIAGLKEDVTDVTPKTADSSGRGDGASDHLSAATAAPATAHAPFPSAYTTLPGKTGLWEILPDGKAAPKGSEISLNFSTGKNYVKKVGLVVGGYNTTHMSVDDINALRVTMQNDRVATSSRAGQSLRTVAQMTLPASGCTIEVCHGDLTKAKTSAIVNAANKKLQHAGALAGAIVRNGGDIIQRESDAWLLKHGATNASTDHPYKYLPEGKVATTSGGKLPCKFVLHVVGPSGNNGIRDMNDPVARRLRVAVDAVFQKAHEMETVASIAIPAISTGAFGFPKPVCADVMIAAARAFFVKHPKSTLRTIKLANFDEFTVGIFKKKLEAACSCAQTDEEGDDGATKDERNDPSSAATSIVVASSVRDLADDNAVATKDDGNTAAMSVAVASPVRDLAKDDDTAGHQK